MLFKLPETLKNTIVIAGATGLVANALKHAFKSIGCTVISISTKESKDVLSWDDVKEIGLPKNTTAVINTCGKNIFSPSFFNKRFINELYESRVGTNLILRDAILKLEKKPTTFITMSGVGIYKPDPSIVHDESSIEYNNDFWSALVTKWEAASELPADCPTKVVQIRSGAILSRFGGMIERMHMPFFLGLGGCIGNGEQYMPFIHIRDLFKLIVFCVEIREINGAVNAVAPVMCTNRQFTEALAHSLRRRARLDIPEKLIRKLVCEERAAILLNSVKVTPKKALDHGFEFHCFDINTSIVNLINKKY